MTKEQGSRTPVPFKFIGQVTSACSMTKARHIERSPTSRHDGQSLYLGSGGSETWEEIPKWVLHMYQR